MDMRRMARTALAAPLLVGGGMLVLTFGTANVFAASPATHANAPANTPQSSSKPHEHDTLMCFATTVPEGGSCQLTFTDPTSNGEHSVGQKVCFSVPKKDGSVVGAIKGNCADVMSPSDTATATFFATRTSCNIVATITAKEGAENGQKHQTMVPITCTGAGSTTNFLVPAGSPSPPTGLLLGAGGLGVALLAGFAVWSPRWLAPRRLAASQSE